MNLTKYYILYQPKRTRYPHDRCSLLAKNHGRRNKWLVEGRTQHIYVMRDRVTWATFASGLCMVIYYEVVMRFPEKKISASARRNFVFRLGYIDDLLFEHGNHMGQWLLSLVSHFLGPCNLSSTHISFIYCVMYANVHVKQQFVICGFPTNSSISGKNAFPLWVASSPLLLFVSYR